MSKTLLSTIFLIKYEVPSITKKITQININFLV